MLSVSYGGGVWRNTRFVIPLTLALFESRPHQAAQVHHMAGAEVETHFDTIVVPEFRAFGAAMRELALASRSNDAPRLQVAREAALRCARNAGGEQVIVTL